MAKEKTIRKHCKNELLEEGYVVWAPSRSRFGSGTTSFKDDYKQGDDIFNIFDLIAWKGEEMRFIQYTSTRGGNVSCRRTKIKEWLEEHPVEIPQGCTIEIWGYKNRKGFTKKINL